MKFTLKQTAAALGGVLLTGAVGTVAAHEGGSIGEPACLEANFMMADAMNAPFGAAGPGRVLEVNIVTGKRGITVNNPFGPSDPNGPVCDNGSGYISCGGSNGPSPFKPTGVLSGGLNGHAFITSAGQQALTEFHRDGTPIRSISYKPLTGNPTGPTGLGTVPRPLGTQMMPNGNIIQSFCDANFFNAQNSDQAPEGDGLEANHYFPPVNSTPDRAQNSRLVVIDQESLEFVDEYSYPYGDDRAELWGCMAGVGFSEEGMGVSMFHTAAIAIVDWKAGLEEGRSTGVGSNSTESKGKGNGGNAFELGDSENQAEILRWIDMRPGKSDTDPSRRDSLRAFGYDEDGTIYATDRVRSKDCVRDEAGCNPSVFRQRVQVVDWGEDHPDRSLALDPGVNVIAGLRPNRMSAVACDNIGGPDSNGLGTACDVETVLIAASAFNAGEILNSGGCVGGHPANACFKPGGGVGEYSIDPDDADGGANNGGGCSGDPTDPAGNAGCAQPLATFLGRVKDTHSDYAAAEGDDFTDPRMLMVIHEAFVQ